VTYLEVNNLEMETLNVRNWCRICVSIITEDYYRAMFLLVCAGSAVAGTGDGECQAED
jgi:hypothetical protein